MDTDEGQGEFGGYLSMKADQEHADDILNRWREAKGLVDKQWVVDQLMKETSGTIQIIIDKASKCP